MKKYTKENISECLSRYVYGPAYYYNKYVIEDGRILGIGKKNNTYYIEIGSDSSFLIDVKRIGNQLYDLLKSDLCPFEHLHYDDNTGLWIKNMTPTLVSKNTIMKHKEKIFEYIYPFIDKYGLPFNYDETKNTFEENNSNDMESICTLFILSHILPMVANAKINSIKIEKMLYLLDTTFEDRFKTLEDIFNKELSILHYATLFEFKYVYEHPLFICKNIFAFAFNSILLKLTKKENISTCKNCGKIITEEYLGVVPPKYCKDCEDEIEKMRNENKKNLDRKQNIKRKEYYEDITKLKNTLIQYDKNNQYIELLDIVDKISNHNDIRFKDTDTYFSCTTIINKLNDAISSLKNNRN